MHSTNGALWADRCHPLGDVTRKPREDDGVEPSVVDLPIGAKHTLAAKACAFCEPQGRDVLWGDEHLEATETECSQRPLGEQAQRLGRDPTATRRGNDPAAELAHPMFEEHCDDLTEVGVTDVVGDDEMQQPAFDPALLEVLRDTRALGGRQRLNPDGGGRILTELERRVEVVRSKWAQRERRACEWGLRIWDGVVDSGILGAADVWFRWGMIDQ